jgi:hypothetical protein
MWLPDKDAAIEVDAEAEEGLDVAPVAVSVALQALQQDPATHANRSIHLAGRHRKIDQSTWPAAAQQSINLSAATLPINPPGRTQSKNTSIM